MSGITMKVKAVAAFFYDHVIIFIFFVSRRFYLWWTLFIGIFFSRGISLELKGKAIKCFFKFLIVEVKFSFDNETLSFSDGYVRIKYRCMSKLCTLKKKYFPLRNLIRLSRRVLQTYILEQAVVDHTNTCPTQG